MIYLHETIFDELKNKKRFYFTRNSIILPKFVGMKIFGRINNKVQALFVQKEFVGHLFGEYFLTKKIGYAIHIDKRKKKKK